MDDHVNRLFEIRERVVAGDYPPQAHQDVMFLLSELKKAEAGGTAR